MVSVYIDHCFSALLALNSPVVNQTDMLGYQMIAMTRKTKRMPKLDYTFLYQCAGV
jgi:hypothetical protein